MPENTSKAVKVQDKAAQPRVQADDIENTTEGSTERKTRVDHQSDGTPVPVAVENPGGKHDQVQGGDPDSGTFVWEYVVLPPKGVKYDESTITDTGQAATETAALGHGYRPSGPAHLVSVTDHHDGVSKVVTWSCPVVRNTGEAAEALLAKSTPPHEPPADAPVVRGEHTTG